ERPDDQVGEAVAVDVTSRRNTVAGSVTGRIALDDEALDGGEARADVGKIDHRAAGAVHRPEPRRLAEHHIGLAGLDAAVVARRRADDQVGEAITIHVARRRGAPAGIVAYAIALDDEAVRWIEGGEVDHRAAGAVDRAEARRLAEHDI